MVARAIRTELMGKRNCRKGGCVCVNVNECEFSIVVMTALNILLSVCHVFCCFSRVFYNPLASRGMICVLTNINMHVARLGYVTYGSVLLSECFMYKTGVDLFSFIEISLIIIHSVPCLSAVMQLPLRKIFCIKSDTVFSGGKCLPLMSTWWKRFHRCEYKREYCELLVQNG